MSGISYSKSFAGGKYNFSTVANTSQTLLTRDITFQMPDFTFTVSSFNPLKSRKKPIADKWYENISMNYMVQFRNRFTTKDTLLFKSRTADEFSKFYDTTGSFGVLHTLPVQTSFKVLKYYTLSGSIGFNEYWYLNSVVKDTVNGGVRTTKVREFSRALTFSPSVSITTRYYGMKNFAKGKIAAIRHVINPSLGFRYTPDFSDDMWGYYKSYRDASGREIKYSRFEGGLMGGPGSGRQGNIEFGVDNNLELKVRRGKDTAMREEKVQIFETFRVGSSYNIFVDSMNLSIINVSARTRLFKNISINSAANFDPYTNTVNTSSNGFKSVNRIKQYAWNNNSFPLMRDASLGVTASFNRDLFKSKSSDRTGMQGELKYINDFPNQYADFSIPWSLNISYSMSYDHYRNLNLPNESNFTQSILFNGDFNLTKKWKINYTSGYDIRNRQFTLTSIDVTRDLHCWQFTFNWIPFGARQSFLFTINVKSSVLQELKLTRRRDWFDRPI
jgi:hypothetical protein